MAKRSYGWRPSAPDHRDHVFAAAPAVTRTLPPAWDLANPEPPPPFSPAWDQTSLGACGPHAACANVVLDALLAGTAVVPMPSRLFVYYVARVVMGTVAQDSGVDNRSMLKALNKYGWCDESLWRYDVARFREAPPQACFDQAAARKITEYLSVPQDLTQMKGCVAGGRPFVFGFTVYESFESPAVADTGVVPMPGARESVLGGHDVLFVGFNDGPGVVNGIPPAHFKFRNSWDGWGYQGSGFGFMPYAYATSPKLAADFWCVRGSGLAPPAPVPPPPPGPPPAPSAVPFAFDFAARRVTLPAGWSAAN